MTYLNGWQIECLAHALLQSEPHVTHVEQASPRRRRHHAGSVTEDRPAFDYFSVFDLLALFPDVLVAVLARADTSIDQEDGHAEG